ncbi:MAG: hypothetical protein MI924_04025 [Chloroflexales bacterium]|nr:hypothetical protein [Chloroflexales bacterium]
MFCISIVIPKLLAEAVRKEGVRIWVTGCATGEEAYSIAILFHEAAQECGFTEKISIFATDAHAGSLRIAANGVYDISRLGQISPEHRERYFQEIAPDQFKVSPELRRMVVFALH